MTFVRSFASPTESNKKLQSELFKLTDWHAANLIGAPGIETTACPVSRFVVDVARFSYDAIEQMATQGMGVIYTHGTDRTPIRRYLMNASSCSIPITGLTMPG